MRLELARVLPLPGPVWGSYPLRPPGDTAPPRRQFRWRSGLAMCRRASLASAAHEQAWKHLDQGARAKALAVLCGELRHHGLLPHPTAHALGIVCACATETLGLTPRPTQRLAAAALLDNRMAEMATGEGKTLAIALAAAVAALAGIAVHVVTANEYLAQRDAAWLAPFFNALGLRATAFSGADTDDAKRAVYQHDIVYATAKDLAFDFLRDRQTLQGMQALERVAADVAGQRGPAPLMRGLCMALLDEADSILLDEAEVPLILSRSVPHAARRAFLWQALALARRMEVQRDFILHLSEHSVVLTAVGEERLAGMAEGLGGPWQRPSYRREAVVVALAGLHAFHRNHEYVVRDGAIELLDGITGRVARGRVWSRGLHTVVALKEGLNPPAETETVAQTTFQRFFQRYWRLCGISGTLKEASAELYAVYGSRVLAIPLHRPCLRRELPSRRFSSTGAMFAEAAMRIGALQALGRPVLIGTGSVAESLQLSLRLDIQGIEHRVLNALNDAQEAAIVGAAGRARQVTVATRMAGRGTDIELDDDARSAGGLHVLCLQRNGSRRLDRQLAGRAGRHGDPGSTEAWSVMPPSRSALDALLARAPTRLAQWAEERKRAMVRRNLLEQDLHWEQRLSFAGTQN